MTDSLDLDTSMVRIYERTWKYAAGPARTRAAKSDGLTIVDTHRLDDEMLWLHGYSPAFDALTVRGTREVFVGRRPPMAQSRFGVALPGERTAVFGVSASGRARARHGASLSRTSTMRSSVRRRAEATGRPPCCRNRSARYLVAGTRSRSFSRTRPAGTSHCATQARTLRLTERAGSHGNTFWKKSSRSW